MMNYNNLYILSRGTRHDVEMTTIEVTD